MRIQHVYGRDERCIVEKDLAIAGFDGCSEQSPSRLRFREPNFQDRVLNSIGVDFRRERIARWQPPVEADTT